MNLYQLNYKDTPCDEENDEDNKIVDSFNKEHIFEAENDSEANEKARKFLIKYRNEKSDEKLYRIGESVDFDLED